MKITFQHLDDEHDSRNGKLLKDRSTIVELLDALREARPPVMCQFVGDNGFNLTIGIDDDFGCIQHSRNDGLPPYLMAIDPAWRASGSGDMEFVVGGTLTPIEGKYRVPFGMLRDVVLEFMASGDRSETVGWQEF
jgi:hypothetical protein